MNKGVGAKQDVVSSFVVPELSRHAPRKIHDAFDKNSPANRTCEIGLTAETGRSYQSIAYLLEQCSRPQETGC